MESIREFYTNVREFYDLALNQTDPRTKDYLLVWQDPKPVLGLIAGYILFIILGKRFMRDRPAFNIPTWVLFSYNFGLVLLSAYMFIEIILGVYEAKYDLRCAKVNPQPQGDMRVVNALWWYFFSKAIEFLDTAWMVLRKKFNQITFLHVFHHSTMLFTWWIVVSWIPGGQAFSGACINCLVHVIMYTYYALSLIPSLRDKLWWKKYLTSFQLIQFMLTLIHTVQAMIWRCDFPMWGLTLQTFYMIAMMVLFTNFYQQEYVKKTNAAKKRKTDINNNNITHDHSEKNGKPTQNGTKKHN